MRRIALVVLLILLSVFLWWLYSSYRVPAGLQPKGAADNIKEWVSLVSAIISTIAALITLITQIRGMKK